MRKPRKTLSFAVVLAILVLSGQQPAAYSNDGSVDSLWNDQSGSEASGPAHVSGSPLCSVEAFKQSALIMQGAWPGVGPFRGSAPEFTDANQNKVSISLDKNRVTAAVMTVADKPKQLIRLQLATDFLLESVGAQQGKISEFNSQLNKSKTELQSSSSREPLNLRAGRYVVAIYPESAHKDLVNFVVRITAKEAPADIARVEKSAPDNAVTAPIVPAVTPQPPLAVQPSRPVKPPAAETAPPPPVAKPEAVASNPDSDLPQPADVPPAQFDTGKTKAKKTKLSLGKHRKERKNTEAASTAAEQTTSAPSPADASAPGTVAAAPVQISDPTSTTSWATPPAIPAEAPAGNSRLAAAHFGTAIPGTTSDLSPAPPATSGDLKTQFFNLITRWQAIKKIAVRDKDPGALPEVLGGRALTRQSDAIKWLQNNKKHYDMLAKNINVDRFNELSAGQKYAVFAQVTEASKYIDDATSQVLKDTTDTYNVNYTIERVNDHWQITDSAIVPPQQQSAAKTPSNTSR